MYTKITFPILAAPIQIAHQDTLYTCGSCFAEELTNRLKTYKFKVHEHPFGIVFNPLSIASQLQHIINQRYYSLDDLVFNDGLYHSLDHHSAYSNADKSIVLESINPPLESAFNALASGNVCVITFGSAHYYRDTNNLQIAANCHKLPASHFEKKRAQIDEILEAMKAVFAQLKKINKDIKIILTVSPVRYFKDGIIENNRSKAVLHLCCEELCNVFDFVSYFPAYEIFMDDLRDYRYVKEDLVHPNKMAIDYIWTYFEKSYLSSSTHQAIHELDQFHKLLHHKILNKRADSFPVFLQKLDTSLKALQVRFPEFDFTTEKLFIENIQNEH
ncbi:MAG: GSCFA domain-containing protein [Saprospiraceae bacterium]|nr:GSCFA domain-containing protein [Saprospiraceae bacterium]MBK9720408.1 GSCFA domain-containing protein [Saprospiraceae bacterium]